MIDEDDFVKARIVSIREKKYNSKQLYNDTKLKFIIEYYNSQGELTEELKQLARAYVILKHGVVYDDTCEYIVNVDLKLVEEILHEIENSVNNNFIGFYESYSRKINSGYSDEFIKSSLNDLITSYTTLRQCQQQGMWKVPPTRIMNDEMTNLYNLLNKQSSNAQHKNEDLTK